MTFPRWPLRLLAILLACYAVFLAAVYVFQRRLIYFPDRLKGEPRLDVGFPARVVSFASTDGVRVTGLYAPPKDDTSAVVLIAHGNMGSIRTWHPVLGLYARQGVGGLLLDPRGYGWSEGSPSEEGWLRDGDAALGWLRAQGIAPERVVVHGVSIGSGIAVPLAAKHPVRGLVLECPFTSLCDVAQEIYPFLPCRLLLRDRYDNVAAAPGVRCPVLVICAGDDEIVSAGHTERLAAAFRSPTTVVHAEGLGHNDLSDWPSYDRTISDFVSGLR